MYFHLWKTKKGTSGKFFNERKNLYYFHGPNFGDDLNRILFERLFGAQLNYCTTAWKADIIAIGSVLGSACIKPVTLRQKLFYPYYRASGKKGKLAILGSGFNVKPDYKIRFARKMDFRMLRGKLTMNYLAENKILKHDVLLGDPGLLASFLIKNRVEKQYRLGIIPHFMDIDSPVIYDIYRKHSDVALFINVQDDPETVIKQIASCENIVSSSLHGLIVADSFGIPNLWIENQWKNNYRNLYHFKYLDYYSIFDIEKLAPVQAFEFFKNRDISDIQKSYKVDYNRVLAKQKELFDFCNNYFRTEL